MVYVYIGLQINCCRGFFSIKNKNLFIIAVSPLKSLYSLQNVQSVCIHFLKEEFYILYTLMLYDQLGSTFG